MSAMNIAYDYILGKRNFPKRRELPDRKDLIAWMSEACYSLIKSKVRCLTGCRFEENHNASEEVRRKLIDEAIGDIRNKLLRLYMLPE